MRASSMGPTGGVRVLRAGRVRTCRLKTRAVLQVVIHCQRPEDWTTLGQYANMIFCLYARCRGKKQEGISFLLID